MLSVIITVVPQCLIWPLFSGHDAKLEHGYVSFIVIVVIKQWHCTLHPPSC